MRKRRRIAASIALALLLGLGIWLGLDNWAFRVKSVRVEGNGSIAADDVIRASKLPLGGKMRSVDETDARAAIESMGTVKFISLKRQYPSTIVLEVEERSRDVVVQQAGVVLTLDRDGYMIEKTDAVPDGSAVYVTGLGIQYFHVGERVGASETRLQALRAVIDALDHQNAREYVSELNLEDENNLYLYTRTGMRVELGDGFNMEDKILWMAGTLPDLESRGETTGRLDVSSGTKADYSPNV